jgi:hypothetical protein
MVFMLQIIRTAIVISTLFSVSSALGQRPKTAAPPDFFVQITARKAFFYADEYIDFSVMKRSGTKLSSNCDFGGSGTVDVLRNGNMIKSFKSGPVSRLGVDTVRGEQYVFYGWGFGGYNFLDDVRPLKIGREEVFQFRATCGDEVSEPSRPFHISEWREPVDGLQVFATPLQKTYKVGEPIRVRVTMRNIGTTPKRCPAPFPDDGYVRNFWGLNPHWRDPRPDVDDKLIYARGLRTLESGESRTAVFRLDGYEGSGQNKTRSLGSEPGKYLLWFSVFFEEEDENVPAKYRKNLWRDHDLTTNLFEIVIE